MKIEIQLISERENILKKLETLFADKAVEAHIFGSIARQQADAYSDIDIWFTFKDEEYIEIFRKRFEYYGLLGNIIHSCEAPQNAPVNGVHTALLLQYREVITVVDIYLCPLLSSYITDENKKLFGIDLPKINNHGFNPQKAEVNNDYRIDFFIGFIFNTVKKIARHQPTPLEAVLREYENLNKNYNIGVEPLNTVEQDVTTLERIIENTKKVSNEKQKNTLDAILNFERIILS
ncbi:MAG: nucleotidyltransferase domain-containing protein [bacterium]